MNKTYLLILLVALFLGACRGTEDDTLKSEIFGTVTVIDENGQDMTKYCNVNSRENAIYLQRAVVGDNILRPIVCTTWYYIYTINLDDLTVNVPRETVATYFGDITISLNNSDKDYSVTVREADTAGLYTGAFPVVHSNLKVGSNKKPWSRSFIDGKTNIMLPGWPNYEHPIFP